MDSSRVGSYAAWPTLIEQALAGNRFEEASALIQQYRQRAESEKQLSHLVRAQCFQTRLFLHQNRLTEAWEEIGRAHHLAQILKDAEGMAFCSQEKARLEFVEGHFDRTLEEVRQLLELARSLKNDSFELEALILMLGCPQEYRQREQLVDQLTAKLNASLPIELLRTTEQLDSRLPPEADSSYGGSSTSTAPRRVFDHGNDTAEPSISPAQEARVVYQVANHYYLSGYILKSKKTLEDFFKRSVEAPHPNPPPKRGRETTENPRILGMTKNQRLGEAPQRQKVEKSRSPEVEQSGLPDSQTFGLPDSQTPVTNFLVETIHQPFALRLLYLCAQAQEGYLPQALEGLDELEGELRAQNATQKIGLLNCDRAAFLYQAGELQESFSLADSLLPLFPSNRYPILFALLEGYADAGFLSKACDLMNQLDSEITPDSQLFLDYVLRKTFLLIHLGAFSEAQVLLQTLKKKKAFLDAEQEIRLNLVEAQGAYEQTHYVEAMGILQKMLRRTRKTGLILLHVRGLCLLLRTCLALGEPPETQEALLQEIQSFERRLGSKLYSLHSLLLQGIHYRQRNDMEKARAFLELACALAQEIAHVRLSWEARYHLAELLLDPAEMGFPSGEAPHPTQRQILEALSLMHSMSQGLKGEYFNSFYQTAGVKALFRLLSKSLSGTNAQEHKGTGAPVHKSISAPVHKGDSADSLGKELDSRLPPRRVFDRGNDKQGGPKVEESRSREVNKLDSRFRGNDTPNEPYFDPFPAIIGRSPSILQLKKTLLRIKDSLFPVLLQGETGVGKDLVAKTIHEYGPRAQRPFIAINCGAIPEPLLESELFGHLQGAFTGAHKEKKGLFVLATGGTLLLDEIGSLPLSSQAKLLRVLEDGQVLPLGGIRPYPVDVRILAATNQDLKQEIQNKTFREDLFFRLSVLTLNLPPLRERKEDIGLLMDVFWEKLSRGETSDSGGKRDVPSHPPGTDLRRLDPQALSLFMNYPWPGNVRELLNTLKALIAFSSGEIIEEALVRRYFVEHKGIEEGGLSKGVRKIPRRLPTLAEAKDAAERTALKQALEASAQDTERAARLLGITRAHVYGLIKKHTLM